MSNLLISVIIPVYNAEDYLERCVNSIRNQTHANLEIILVDDGSKDNSLALCQKLAGYDERVHVIHQENSGVSAARNAALLFATGAYIAYIDADDYIDVDYLRRLLDNAVQHDADISCCDFVEILNGEQVHISLPKVCESRMVPDQYSLFYDSVAGKETYGTCVWGKLIRTELARKVTFKPLKFGEDQVYMYDLFCIGPRVYLDTYQGYYYIRNEGSVTVKAGNHSIARSIDEMNMHQYKLENLSDEMGALYPRFYDMYAFSVHAYARAVALSGNQQEWKENRMILCPIINKILRKAGYLSNRSKIYLVLYRYFPGLYRGLFRTMANKNAIG